MAELQYKNGFVEKSVNYYNQCGVKGQRRGMKAAYESGPSKTSDLNTHLGGAEQNTDG